MEIYLNSFEVCNKKYGTFYSSTINAEQMGFETFKIAINIMATSDKDDNILTLTGIEPLENPDFLKILNLAYQYQEIFKWRIIICTNGINVYKYIDYFNAKTEFIINIFSKEELGEENYFDLLKSLKLLKEKGYIDKYTTENVNNHWMNTNCCIPLIVIDDNFKEEDFWKISDMFLFRHIEIFIKPHNINDKIYWHKVIQKVKDFTQTFFKKGIELRLGCSFIPWCLLNYDDCLLLALTSNGKLSKSRLCSHCIGVFPDLSIRGCCTNWKKEESLKQGREHCVSFAKESRKLDKCELCQIYDINVCNGICKKEY